MGKVEKRCKKMFVILLAFVMVLTLLPAFTMPVKAQTDLPDGLYWGGTVMEGDYQVPLNAYLNTRATQTIISSMTIRSIWIVQGGEERIVGLNETDKLSFARKDGGPLPEGTIVELNKSYNYSTYCMDDVAGMTRIKLMDLSDYILTYRDEAQGIEYTAEVSGTLPTFGVFSENLVSVDTFISDFGSDKQVNVPFYFLVNDNLGEAGSNYKTLYTYTEFALDTQGKPDGYWDDKISIETLEEGKSYKVTFIQEVYE